MSLNILTAITAFKRKARECAFGSGMQGIIDELDAAHEVLKLVHEEARRQKWLLQRAETALGHMEDYSSREAFLYEGSGSASDNPDELRKWKERNERARGIYAALRENRIARAQHIRHNVTGDRRRKPNSKGL